MTCLHEALRELKLVQRAAPPPPEIDQDLRRDPVYRAGYIAGHGDSVREAISIVEEAEENHEEDY